MTENKTTKAQKKAIQNWRKNNPEANRINSYRSTARTFCRHYATKQDMDELIEIFNNENQNAK